MYAFLDDKTLKAQWFYPWEKRICHAVDFHSEWNGFGVSTLISFCLNAEMLWSQETGISVTDERIRINTVRCTTEKTTMIKPEDYKLQFPTETGNCKSLQPYEEAGELSTYLQKGYNEWWFLSTTTVCPDLIEWCCKLQQDADT